MNSSINNNVNIGGDQRITGVKTYSNSNLVVKDSRINRADTAPAESIYSQTVQAVDANGNSIGYLGVVATNTGRLYTRLVANNHAGNTGSTMYIGFDSSDNVVTYSPPCDVNNSILTTTGKSFGTYEENGYCKLGNGLIIQWGTIEVSSYNATGTVTLPTAFSSAVFAITAGARRTDGAGQGSLIITGTMNKTKFTWAQNASSSNYTNRQMWIAFGV